MAAVTVATREVVGVVVHVHTHTHTHTHTHHAHATHAPETGKQWPWLRNIRVVSFDLDDTLWRCDPVLVQAEKDMHAALESRDARVLTALRHAETKAELERAILAEHPHARFAHSFMRRTLLKRVAMRVGYAHDDAHALSESVFSVFFEARSKHVSNHFFDGSVPALERLKRLGFRIGTITNGNADVRRIPELAPLVETHVQSEEAGAPKPEPAPFEALLERMGVKPEEVLHVGDSLSHDVQGAKRVGMRTCWIRATSTDAPRSPEEASSEADMTFATVRDMVDAIEAALLYRYE